jgi:hypothetical protein
MAGRVEGGMSRNRDVDQISFKQPIEVIDAVIVALAVFCAISAVS